MRKMAEFVVVSFLAPTLSTADSGAAQAAPVEQDALVPISVTHAASFIPFDPIENPEFTLTSNTFATIFGAIGDNGASGKALRLLPPGEPRAWNDEFVDGMAPTSLNGVRVVLNGKEAFIAFTTRGEDLFSNFDQINFLTPEDDTRGLVTLDVFQGEQRVATTMVNLGELSPGLFELPAPSGETFIIARSTTAELLLRPDAVPPLRSRSARVGEVILLFGTGYGRTEPPIPIGRVPFRV